MIFIFNDVLLELGDPRDRLIKCGCPLNYGALNAMTPPQILGVVRSVLFDHPTFAQDRKDKAAALGALVHIKTGANALLCIRTPDVQTAGQMPVRLAEASLEVISELSRRGRSGALNAAAIDQAVWAA
jgi:hypothetical protein